MSFSKREIQQYFYNNSQKNFAIMNHVFDEMQKMQSEIKLLQSKVNFQDSVLSSLVRPTLSGIQPELPNCSAALDHDTSDNDNITDVYDGYDMEQPPEREKLTLDDLCSDSQSSYKTNPTYHNTPAYTGDAYDAEEQSLSMDDFFRKSQIKGIRPVPLTRQTNRLYQHDETDTFTTSMFNERLTQDDYLKDRKNYNQYRARMHTYNTNPNELGSVPPVRQRCYPLSPDVSKNISAAAPTTPFNYTCYNPEFNWV